MNALLVQVQWVTLNEYSIRTVPNHAYALPPVQSRTRNRSLISYPVELHTLHIMHIPVNKTPAHIPVNKTPTHIRVKKTPTHYGRKGSRLNISGTAFGFHAWILHRDVHMLTVLRKPYLCAM